MHKQKGFTLIELLVVIGIIGILSTIVYTSLNNRQKNKEPMSEQDARIKRYTDCKWLTSGRGEDKCDLILTNPDL